MRSPTTSKPFRARRARALVLVALVAATLAPAADAASQGARDIVFTLDASDNLSPSEWSIVQQGLAKTVSDPVQYPRDCSRGIAAVTYAASATIAVPYRQICSEADAEALAAAFLRMPRLGGSTADPALGVEAAISVFVGPAPSTRNETIALAPAGLPPDPSRLETSVASAQRYGIENLTVLSVATQRTSAESLEASYREIPYNEGVFEAARNVVEWAMVVDIAALLPTATLVAIEVNQAVQSWLNNWTLIGKKPTMVRLHMQATGSVKGSARLFGTRDGQPLPGSPLSALNTPTLVSNAVSVRDNAANSVNFFLPTSWIGGTVTLTVKGLGLKLVCKDKTQIDDDCAATVTFKDPPQNPDIRYVRIARPDQNQAAPDAGEVVLNRIRQQQIFPIIGIDSYSSTYPWKGTGAKEGDLEDLLAKLDALRKTDTTCPECYYYGILRETPDYGGLGYMKGRVAAGSMPEDDAWAHARNRHAHELLHNLGVGHSVYNGVGQCGEDPEPGEHFDHWATINGSLRPVLGPLDGTEDEKVYGMVPEIYFTNKSTSVVDPYTTFELMGYCGALVTGQGRWISSWNYAFAYGYLRTLLGTQASATAVAGDGAETLLVRGRIDEVAGRVSFMPFLRVGGRLAPEAASGEYVLRLLDADGGVLRDVAFEPSEAHADAPGRDGTASAFAVPVPDPGPARAVQILRDGRVLGERRATANPPTIALTTHDGGGMIAGDTTIRWDASDPDGDELTYLVQYSPDGGATWQSLSVDTSDRSLLLERAAVRASTRALVRVIATDGFDSAADVSASTFTLENNAPTVALLTPGDGATFAGTHGIAFGVDARDNEDGTLDGARVEWRSSRDGVLGAGASLYREADTLSEGIHTITATATDAHGATASASITIVIRRVAPGGDTVPPVVHAVLSTGATPSGWHRTSVQVQLSASDDGVGVADVGYRIDGGAETIVPGATATIAITTPGTHTIAYRARDHAGNASAPQTLAVRLDPTPPTASMTTPDLSIVPPGQTPVTLRGVASDPALGATPGSGIRDACFDVQRVDLLAPSTSFGCIPALSDGAIGWSRTVALGTGVYNVALSAVDRAGNPTRSEWIRIVVLAP